ncbi:MAG TPA: hypothetical protein VF843_14320, partial [Streptosporangiaceae bacterium]
MSSLNRGLELLGSAAAYALASASLAGPRLLSEPTPCAGWDLAALLNHASESIALLHDAMAGSDVLRCEAWAAGPARAAGHDPAARLRGAAA